MKPNLGLLARDIRAETLRMVSLAKASHVGGALSMADILAALYGRVLKFQPDDPAWELRDRFILSKGHSTSSLYAALALVGFFPRDELLSYGKDGSRLMSHVSAAVPGVEFSTGSLGHGLPFGTGKALAAKRKGSGWRTFVLLSDGELDEGSNWEAILFAGHHKLDQLTMIVDYNKIQSLGAVNEVLGLEPLEDKLQAFGWHVIRTDGHSPDNLAQILGDRNHTGKKPRAVIADTVKGKGVPFMENNLLWHYRNPSPAELESALQALGIKEK